MDLLYGHDRKLGYLEEPDMVDFLDSSDIFEPPLMTGFPTPEDEGFEHDWLNSFLDDPVLNDKMMTDAMNPPCIKSEHSYSINDNGEPGSPTGLENHEDVETDLFAANSALDLTMKSVSTSPPTLRYETSSAKSQTVDSFLNTTTTCTLPVTTAATLGLSTARQPTIIVTTTSAPSHLGAAPSFSLKGETISYPTIQIKQEPSECLDQSQEQTVSLDSITMPLTPPGSSGSDSEGGQSPQPSAPNSPIRQTYRHSTASPISGKPYTQPLFVNSISPAGVLILSEEEKRTLISEGYPIPTKLPLTKQEEKNLKKIRRKIKNKISAQESRRKKKEYLEALEKRVEAFNHENNDLKKKVESLENNNRSLLGQLQKLQSLVSRMPKASTQTGTALMVLVFCFAVFLGSLSPSNLNIGYHTKPAMLGFVPPSSVHASNMGPQLLREMGPRPLDAQDNSDPYATPNLKSRMLMSVENDNYCDDFRSMPWESAMSCPTVDETKYDEEEDLTPPGVDLMGGAVVGEDVGVDKSHAQKDTTVIMVVTGSMENASDISGDAYLKAHGSPDVMISGHSELISPDILPNASLATELETAA